MLKLTMLSTLLFLMMGCSNQSKEQNTKTEVPPAEILAEKHWETSYFSEAIFNSNVAVLEAGQKDKPAIILIHGLGQLGMKDWFSVIPFLESNFHVIAIDLPGFGLSESAQGRFSPSQYARVIAAINDQYNGSSAIVMGHSMGAAVALRYSDMYPQNVDHLIMVDAAGILEKSTFIKHIAAIEYGDDTPILIQKQIQLLNEFSSSMIEVGTKNTTLNNLIQNNDSVWDWLTTDSNNINAALSLVEEDYSQAVNRLTVPVDIIWGSDDNIAPLRTGKVLHKQMLQTRLQVIDGAKHMPMKTHNRKFIEALRIAVSQPFVGHKQDNKAQESQGKLICHGQRDKTYSGYYESISIKGCDNIRLSNISTASLFIKGSVVEIENLKFDSESNQIVLEGAVVTITNADISGHNPLLISGSRLDMAGVSIDATGIAVNIKNGSRISVSLSDIKSPQYTGVIHGAFYLTKQPLVK